MTVLPALRDSRHYKLSQKVLVKCEVEALKRHYSFKYDSKFPYHIIVIWLKMRFSVFCDGFSKRIDIARLTVKGNPDMRTKEVGFMTVEGAFNWLDKTVTRLLKRSFSKCLGKE